MGGSSSKDEHNTKNTNNHNNHQTPLSLALRFYNSLTNAMSPTTTESPIRKVIFAQRIFRFAGRTPKDLVIINFVCKDFEETMQAHHTFNLVLYDNIIKKRKDEEDFFWQAVRFLSAAPAWIVYQWTTVNEYDETQRELLKEFLLYQAENDNIILVRCVRLLNSKEDPSTTRELFLHILDSCVKLGIAKEVLEASGYATNCIMQAVSRKISVDSLSLLIESCVQYGVDMKELFEQENSRGWNCIMRAAGSQCPCDFFKLLIESCAQHADMKKVLEEKDSGCNCIMQAAANRLPVDSFKLLIDTCIQHGINMKTMLEERNTDDRNCIMLAVSPDHFTLLRSALNAPSTSSGCLSKLAFITTST